MWIPYFGTGTVAWSEAAYFITGKQPIEEYAFWCSACPSLNLLFDVREKNLDYDKIRKLTEQFRVVMPYYYGDYYPLMPHNRDEGSWIAWQFNRPDSGDGIVQAFRRKKCIYESVRLKLQGLDPQAKYEFATVGDGTKSEATGEELMKKGIPIAIDACPGVANVEYRKISAAK
jgi:alpha-galactosidase